MSNLLKELQKEKAELIAKIAVIDNAIRLYQGNDSVNDTSTDIIDGYDINWSFSEKIVFILKTKNKFLKIKEIAEEIIKYESSNKNTDVVISNIRGSLYALRDENVIVIYILNKQLKNTYYGSPNWLDEHGNIKAGHEFQKTQKQILSIA